MIYPHDLLDCRQLYIDTRDFGHDGDDSLHSMAGAL